METLKERFSKTILDKDNEIAEYDLNGIHCNVIIDKNTKDIFLSGIIEKTQVMGIMLMPHYVVSIDRLLNDLHMKGTFSDLEKTHIEMFDHFFSLIYSIMKDMSKKQVTI
jgi:hypothetical protein